MRNLWLALSLVTLPAFAEERAPASISTAGGGGQKTRVIDFEGGLVEGINRRPYDSLNQLGDANRRRDKNHLYRKRSGFSSEIRETLSEMRFAP